MNPLTREGIWIFEVIYIGGLFKESNSKYSKIVTATSVPEARESIKKLRKEYRSGKERKRERIRKVALYASNRISAMAKNPKYSPETRREKKRIAKIYKEYYKSIRGD